jgi:hypothetical protein
LKRACTAKLVGDVNGVGELLRNGKDQYMAWINIAVLLPDDIVNSPLIFINLFVSANTTPHSSKKGGRNQQKANGSMNR